MGKLNEFKKIKGIKYLKKYNLPIPETIFIFDFKKQEKEIDDFLKNRRIVTIRSDKKGKTDFCPHNLRCERSKAKNLIKKLISRGYAVILQRYIPIRRDRVSGNILALKNHILIELMGTGPLTWLNRDGRVEEQIKVENDSFKKVGHLGKRLVTKKELTIILRAVKNVPPYKILEFTLRPEGIYFWQIRDDRTARNLNILSGDK